MQTVRVADSQGGKGGLYSSTCSRNVLLSQHSFILLGSDIAFQGNNSHGDLAGMGIKILEGAEVCGLFFLLIPGSWHRADPPRVLGDC